jgi:glutathione S-transferase
VLFESNVICEYLEETQPGARLHAEDPLTRAEHRAWMEFGSAILGDLWGYETTQDAAVFEQKRLALVAKFERVEAALGAGPYFAGERFSLVDAVFAPVFRYFELFDQISDSHVFDALPKVDAWRKALAARPSVRNAVVPEYPQHLMEFLKKHQSHLLTLAA